MPVSHVLRLERHSKPWSVRQARTQVSLEGVLRLRLGAARQAQREPVERGRVPAVEFPERRLVAGAQKLLHQLLIAFPHQAATLQSDH